MVHSCHVPVSVQSARCTQTLAASTAAPFASEKAQRFEHDLDFKARISIYVEALCWLVPPLLIFGVPLALGTSRDSIQATMQAARQMAGSGHKPWLRWLGAVALWLGKALVSTLTSVVLRYEILESQVGKRPMLQFLMTSQVGVASCEIPLRLLRDIKSTLPDRCSCRAPCAPCMVLKYITILLLAVCQAVPGSS